MFHKAAHPLLLNLESSVRGAQIVLKTIAGRKAAGSIPVLSVGRASVRRHDACVVNEIRFNIVSAILKAKYLTVCHTSGSWFQKLIVPAG